MLTIFPETPPIVELDSEARAAYVRFSSEKVVVTRPLTTEGCIITIDFDAAGEPVGIELLGVSEFGVGPLLQQAGVTLPAALLGRTRYVPANLQPA